MLIVSHHTNHHQPTPLNTEDQQHSPLPPLTTLYPLITIPHPFPLHHSLPYISTPFHTPPTHPTPQHPTLYTHPIAFTALQLTVIVPLTTFRTRRQFSGRVVVHPSELALPLQSLYASRCRLLDVSLWFIKGKWSKEIGTGRDEGNNERGMWRIRDGGSKERDWRSNEKGRGERSNGSVLFNFKVLETHRVEWSIHVKSTRNDRVYRTLLELCTCIEGHCCLMLSSVFNLCGLCCEYILRMEICKKNVCKLHHQL